jgi:hypothetical protein
VRVKKTKTSSRGIRYLLSVDQKLQRISLRRISARVKKAKRPPRSIPLKNSVGVESSVSTPQSLSSRAIILGMTCVVAVAALVAARQPANLLDVAPGDAMLEASAALRLPQMPAKLDMKDIVVPQSHTLVTAAADTPSLRPAPADKPVEAPVVEPPAKSPLMESPAKAAAEESVAQADVQNVPSVTITGCLQRDQETFWLKDTSGEMDMPRSRSWRSGFLKKRASRVGLVAADNTVKLPDYLGERVAATGTLVDREMQARSVRRVSTSCN